MAEDVKNMQAKNIVKKMEIIMARAGYQDLANLKTLPMEKAELLLSVLNADVECQKCQCLITHVN
jgi:hypothetical protein